MFDIQFSEFSFIKSIILILDTQGKFQQSTLISESEFLGVGSSSSTDTADERITTVYRNSIEIQYSPSFYLFIFRSTNANTKSWIRSANECYYDLQR